MTQWAVNQTSGKPARTNLNCQVVGAPPSKITESSSHPTRHQLLVMAASPFLLTISAALLDRQ